MNEHHDTSLWLLAAVPLGATLVLHAVFGPVPLVWLATAVLNLILLILDSRQAKNEGNGYSFWLFLSGLIIMPFYLYRRTVKTSGINIWPHGSYYICVTWPYCRYYNQRCYLKGFRTFPVLVDTCSQHLVFTHISQNFHD